jgi:hypothetical protein
VSGWWGDFELALAVSYHWRIGSLSLWITRLEREFRVSHAWSGDPFDETIEIAREGVEVPEGVECRRYLFASEAKILRLTPRVADRPVVSRPEIPLIIPAGESATIYMASPVWVELAAGEHWHGFFDVPIWRVSSTWFGDNTLEGTLCYATRSRARLEATGARGPRVTTSVELSNEHREPLRVDRLALPLPQMSVFGDAAGQLWTEATTVAYDPANEAPARIGSAPPDEVGPTTLISRPRKDRHDNILTRALAAALKGVLP